MKQVKVKITKPAATVTHGDVSTGDIITVSEGFAAHLVDDCGVAEYLVDDTAPQETIIDEEKPAGTKRAKKSETIDQPGNESTDELTDDLTAGAHQAEAD